jgi:hypothetical protein
MNPRSNRPLSRSRGSARKPGGRGLVTLILVCDAVFVLVHLWGRVQIDFALRANQRLTNRRSRLQAEVADLAARNEKLKSYDRISGLARLMGLESVSSDRLDHLPVDLRGVDRSEPSGRTDAVLAGMAWFGKRSGGTERPFPPSGGGDAR